MLIRDFYTAGVATKDEYAKALHVYQAYLDDIRSDQRDAAASDWERFRYYESYTCDFLQLNE